MTYRFLRQDAHPQCWTPLHASGFPIAQLSRGTPIAVHVDEPVLVRLSAWGEVPTDFMERPLVVVSGRMRAALERAGVDNVQYFAARAQNELSYEVHGDYWLANILGRVACLDPAGNDLDDEMTITDVQRLVIDPVRTYDLGLFRLAEDPRMIVAAPRVQRVLTQAALSGVLFQDPVTYSGGRALSHADLQRTCRDMLDEPGSRGTGVRVDAVCSDTVP